MRRNLTRKVQIAIDKMVDILDSGKIKDPAKVVRILEKLRELESDIEFGEIKNGQLSIY